MDKNYFQNSEIVYYETPLSFINLFDTFEKTEEGEKKTFVKIFIYIFEYEENKINLLISPVYLGQKIPVVKYINKSEYDFIPNFIDIEIFDQCKEIEKNIFLNLIEIHENFFKMAFVEMNEINKKAYIDVLGEFEKKLINDKSVILNNNNNYDVYFKNYLFVPLQNNKKIINLGLEVTDFFLKKSDVSREIEKLKNTEKLEFNTILKGQILKKKIEPNFSSPFTIFLCHLGDLNELTFEEYLKILSEICYKFSNKDFKKDDFFSNIKKYYNLEFFDFFPEKITYLIKNNLFGIESEKQLPILDCIFDVIENAEEFKKKKKEKNFDFYFKEKKFFLGMDLPDVKKLDFTMPSVFEDCLNEKKCFKMIKNNSIDPSMLKIYSIDDFDFFGFNCKKLNGWYKNLSLLKNFEISVLHRELQNMLNLYMIDFEYLSIALTPTSMEKMLNYEVFETIGDSILKFLTTVDLFFKNPSYSEGQLTQARSNLVSNKFLKKIAMENGVHLFIKSYKRNINEFIPPYFHINWDKINDELEKEKTDIYKNKNFKEIEENKKESLFRKYIKEHSLGDKTIADVIEALIGGAYFTNRRLLESFQFMKSIGILKKNYFQNIEQIFFESLEINEEIFIQKDIDRFLIDMNFADLFYLDKKEKKREMIFILDKLKNNLVKIENEEEKKNFTDNFINDELTSFQNDLGYSFKNVDFLKEVFKNSKNFQRLEFMGDTVLDIYSLINLYNLAIYLNISLTPEMLHNFKVYFLSSETLAKITKAFNLISFFEFEDESQKEQILKYIQSNADMPMKNLWNESQILAPKICSDIFEAFIGAVFLDRGFEGVKILLDEIIVNFMVFYLKFYRNILIDIKSYLINLFSKKGVKIAFENNETSVFLKVGTNVVISKDIGEKDTLKQLEHSIAMEYLNNLQKNGIKNYL